MARRITPSENSATLCATLNFEDDGEFRGRLCGDGDTRGEFYIDYPELNRALDLWARSILAREVAISIAEPEVEHTALHHDKAIADAVARERTRLIAKF